MGTLRAFAGLVGLGLVAAACAASPPPPIAAPAPATLTPAAIVKEHGASVVRVVRDGAFGTGFVVARDRIATNFHVVEGATALSVVLSDGSKREVTGLWLPEHKDDLAVLQVDTTGMKPLVLADSGALHPGEHVVALGNPKGLDHTVSDGIVGALRTGELMGGDPHWHFVQHSAPISHGSSGGPLFNDRGEVIGVNTLGVKDGENLNFSVASNDLAPLVKTTAAPITIAQFATAARAGESCDARKPNVRPCVAECMAGAAASCTSAGVMYGRAVGVPRDDAKAATYYRRACEGGDALGCSNLAYLYRYGEGLGKDVARATAIFRDTCERGLPYACLGRAQMTGAGEGMPASSARALALFTLACDGRIDRACMEGGALAEKAKGAHRFEKVSSFYQRACDFGMAQGCTKLGVLLSEAHGVPRDDARAARLFQAGCAKHDVEACSHYGVALVEGRGIAPDRARGLEELQWSCANGAGASCEKIALLQKR